MKTMSFFRKHMPSSIPVVLIVLLLGSLTLNLFLAVESRNKTTFTTNCWPGGPRTLSREQVSLDYQGSLIVGDSNYVDRFVLSNGVNVSVYTYRVQPTFEQATYLSQTSTVHSSDYLLADGAELSSNLIEIPPGRIYEFDINRCKVDFPWKFQREVLLRNTFDSSCLFYIDSQLVYTNRLLQDIMPLTDRCQEPKSNITEGNIIP